MSVCTWCHAEMTTAISCTVAAFHRQARRFDMAPFGSEPGWPSTGDRCGDCGVYRGGWHHPGCDLQRCPSCHGQLMSCDCRFDEDDFDEDDFDEDEFDEDGADAEPFGVDGNGCLTERMWFGEQEVIIHRDDVPDSDITELRGIRCTTALRTVIDIAPETEPAHLEEIVDDCLQRGLFTVGEAWRRLAQPDMVGRRGAELLRRVLPPVAE